MINILWVLLVIIGVVYAIFTNRLELINEAIMSAPKTAFSIMTALFINLVFWNGIMHVCSDGGLLRFLSKIIKKFIRPLFKKIPSNHPSLDYISGNVAANLLGLGSAATPMGLKAMEQLSLLNEGKKIASKEMITLLVLNTSGLTILPTAILSIRRSYGAKINLELIPQVIIASVITTIIALLIDLIFRKVAK